MLEPGRALLDEAGISLFKVQGTKPHLAHQTAISPHFRAQAYHCQNSGLKANTCRVRCYSRHIQTANKERIAWLLAAQPA